MDMQSLIDAISLSGQMERQRYHLTLGGLIEQLKGVSPETPVKFADGTFPGTEDSYRGHYSDLAFESTTEPKTASELLTQAEKALGATYEGYKGGDFVMDEKTPLWNAPYGAIGAAIMDCVTSGDGLLLVTKFID